jgi:transcriptional regulator with XRE-family HTH domain
VDEDLKRIAQRIRSWRDDAGLTLQRLGDLSSVSASTIHKIENLQTVPTISVLLKVAHGLNRRPSELLAEVEVGRKVSVTRSAERPSLEVVPGAMAEHLIGMIPRNKLDAWRVRLEPGTGAGMGETPAWHFSGEMAILVEEGAMEVEVGDETYHLETGDSIHFDSSLPHRWVAGEGLPAEVIALAVMPERLQGDLRERVAEMTGAVAVPAVGEKDSAGES